MINPFHKKMWWTPKKITKQKYTNIRNRIKNHLKMSPESLDKGCMQKVRLKNDALEYIDSKGISFKK